MPTPTYFFPLRLSLLLSFNVVDGLAPSCSFSTTTCLRRGRTYCNRRSLADSNAAKDNGRRGSGKLVKDNRGAGARFGLGMHGQDGETPST